jgi:rhodanese-related sulfurtransferase
VNLAGMAAQNVRGELVSLAQWHEVAALNPATTVLLDVRNPEEWAYGEILDSVKIPLNELRTRLGELPKDKEIVVHCQSGQRSYFACRILAQHGFRVRNLTGSFRTWSTATRASG